MACPTIQVSTPSGGVQPYPTYLFMVSMKVVCASRSMISDELYH